MSKKSLAQMADILAQMSPDTPDYRKTQKEFLQRYHVARKQSEESLLGRLSLKQRQRLHPFLLGVIKLKNRLGGLSVDVLHDRRGDVKEPVIFAVTHVGKNDVETVSEAIGSHYTLLSGDFERMQGTINETFLKLNGVVYVCECDKEDRRFAMDRMVAALTQGSNLMYFPEGTWNLSDHLPMLPCYWGIVQVAQASAAAVIPVAAEQYGKHFVVNIGEAIHMEPFGDDKPLAITTLRDAMATLKWEIWESQPQMKRHEVRGDEWECFIKARLKEWPLTLDGVWAAAFRPKGVISREEVFAHLKSLAPCPANAFLFDKRLKGY